mgnify:FL=1
MKQLNFSFIFSIVLLFIFFGSKSQSTQQINNGDIQFWLTEGNKSALFSQQKNLHFTDVIDQLPSIEIDSTQKFQSIDGFGFCLTDGSAYLINSMTDAAKNNLLKELFSTDGNAI